MCGGSLPRGWCWRGSTSLKGLTPSIRPGDVWQYCTPGDSLSEEVVLMFVAE